MASLQQKLVRDDEGKDQFSDEYLLANILKLHESLSKLESLKPSFHVNNLFTQLVNLCTLPSSIDINCLSQRLQCVRQSLIIICARAEGLLELEFATLLTKLPKPITNNCLTIFPYFNNYVELTRLEYTILRDHGLAQQKRLAFVGSGPLPFTSILLAKQHMGSTNFTNYDVDEAANEVASRLVATDDDLAKRMTFKSCDIRQVKETELGEFDCVFVAALVGMTREEKVEILDHVGKCMKPGGYLLVRSAKGSRAFLYPVVEEEDLSAGGFQILHVFHPTNEVINSVILARKPQLF